MGADYLMFNFEIISRISMELTVIEFALSGMSRSRLSGTSQDSARSVIDCKQQDAPVPIGPGRKCSLGGLVQAVGAPTRRPPRRLTARRSSSLIPPHTPAS